MEKVFFVVERDHRCQEHPSIYRDGIPLRQKDWVIWGIELKTPEAQAETIEDLYRMYRLAKYLDNLAPSGLIDRDFYTSK